MKIHAINAFEGDCLLLESGGPGRRFALVDGGPPTTFDTHLGSYLQSKIGSGGTLEAVIVSHVDRDHIVGVLDLIADLEARLADGTQQTVQILDIWHNSFARTIDDGEGSIVSRLHGMMSAAGKASFLAANGSLALLGIREGERLRRQALKLGLPLNGKFNGGLISVDEQDGVTWDFGDATFSVVGPTAANLQQLRQEWARWIEDHIDEFEEGDPQAMANADRSIPNLSSIVLLGTTPDGDILLTGDARGDHILQGLEQSQSVPVGGSRHFRLLKVQHHGSDRNVARDFFERLTADIYLISADGKHGNPDFEVLEMIVDVAQQQQRQPLIVVTNAPAAVQKLRTEKPPQTSGYTLAVRDQDKDAIVVDLASGTAVSE